MLQVTQRLQVIPRENPEYEYITTTLYDLFEAIDEELQAGEEVLLGRIVLDLAQDHKDNIRGKFFGAKDGCCLNTLSLGSPIERSLWGAEGFFKCLIANIRERS